MSETQTLQYRFDGPEDGPVLILGPSLGTTWHMWDRQIPELSRHWRVLRFDLPGHGGAAAHPAHSIPDLAERLLGTLDMLGIDRFGYAGCSIGAAIGAELALRHPLRLGSLALVSAAPRFGTADSYRQRGVVVRTNGLDPIARATPDRWFTPMFAAGQPAIVDWSVQMVRTTDPGCYIAACEALAAFDIRAELGRIGAPTLVVVGADDEVTPPADARVMVAGIPDARLALVPGASHLAPVEQPTAVTDLLVRHFSASWQSADQPTGMTAIPTPAARSMLATAPPTGVPVNGFPVNGFPANGVPVNGVPVNGAANGAVNGVHITGAPVAEISYVEPGSALVDTRSDAYEKGIRVRREVLGDAHVDRAQSNADEFTGDFQDFITRYAWGEVWNRPGLDRRTRSVITLTALAARGHLDELAFHTRAALRNGLTPAEIKEVLLHTAVYCGVPTANSAFAVAQRVIREETTPEG
ncbi:4-carboxymuconolactone decarboxylase [Streptomyces sp. NBS 14/10]|uniref:bifunctional 3-oxoadipate enol-lactonase/4-carboxymuconolactone decarboxylase PcaDC n=1 Tax=Streptomyces sp. NBS 14/10 TaxID=1945643 RepID=UPI000B7D1FDA|nr:4-carboxymuconolactone decarboxylase [Streptomyces sp. NBS 14/10]KAK1182998.1 4-carboxymuconolactone decarboxylase [Streptomyces sp. NBS 14/10]